VSDHISGPRALAEPIADITDFYAFPSPERPGYLVLIQNTLPFAPPSALFSDGLVYRFRLRPVRSNGVEDAVPFALEADELTVDCVFEAPVNQNGDGGFAQAGICTISTSQTVDFQVNDESTDNFDDVRVFAGPRWDPFFMDAPAALKTIATQQLAFTSPGSIYLDGKNVLSLVVEIDVATLLGGAQLVAVVTETLTRGKFPVRIERVGRPEVKNLMLGPKQFDTVNRDLEIRDLYNMEDAFKLAEAYQGAYRARLNANLAVWDSLDGKSDWPTSEAKGHALTELILADYLVLDVSKSYSESGSFLEIERAARERRVHSTCGGRAPNDDVMDTIFTLLVNANHGPRISDGVDRATMPAAQIFPYLASPNPHPPQPPAHH
jgi:Domain of unknown function (DUF4331)